ncbi:EVE domain-containing protein, partial [Acinetobacter baumannii]
MPPAAKSSKTTQPKASATKASQPKVTQTKDSHSTKDSKSSKVNYWLFKSEPNVFSISDLAKLPKSTTCWDGV